MRLSSAGGRWSGLPATRPPGRSAGDLLRHLSGGPGRPTGGHDSRAPRAFRTTGPPHQAGWPAPDPRVPPSARGGARPGRSFWRGGRQAAGLAGSQEQFGRTGAGQGRGANGLWGQSDVRCRWERLRAYLGGFGRSPDASGPGSGFRAAAGRGYGASADD